MILNKDTIKLLFGYGVGIFSLFLLIGPLISELMLYFYPIGFYLCFKHKNEKKIN